MVVYVTAGDGVEREEGRGLGEGDEDALGIRKNRDRKLAACFGDVITSRTFWTYLEVGPSGCDVLQPDGEAPF